MGRAEADEEMIRLLGMSGQELDSYFAALPPDGTSTILVKDLEQRPQSEARDKIINNAKRYMYDDFKSPHVCGKMELHKDLMKAGYKDLAQKVVDGDYDSGQKQK